MKPIVFLDLETTGLDPNVHEIIEVAAIQVDARSLTELDVLHLRIKPERLGVASVHALNMNGFDIELWEDASFIGAALMQLFPLLDGAMLAGHNVNFDRTFLDAAYKQLSIQPPKLDHHTLDTASLAWPLYSAGEIDSLSLASVCKALNVDGGPPHRALSDARRSLDCARRLLGPLHIAADIAMLHPDESRIVSTIVKRIAAAEGEYGPWSVHDGRDYPEEAFAEIVDGMAYLAAELVRLGSRP
jgi:DNA polymerase-3 subunit epsilon